MSAAPRHRLMSAQSVANLLGIRLTDLASLGAARFSLPAPLIIDGRPFWISDEIPEASGCEGCAQQGPGAPSGPYNPTPGPRDPPPTRNLD
jgi:hypothetical protein